MTGSRIRTEQGRDTESQGGGQRLEIPGSEPHVKMSDGQYLSRSTLT